MKINLSCLIAAFMALGICMQANGQNKAVKPTTAVPRPDSINLRGAAGTLPDIREKLVQLAVQNPSVEIDDRNIAVSQYMLKNSKSAVLNQIVLQGNLNEYSIQANPQQFGTLYPRYNIGATL